MRFEIIRLLGTGSTGEVLLARDLQRNGAFVAIKRLHPHIQFTLEQEATLAQSVSHRHACRVHDVHREDGRIVISMEYVDGETLRAVIQRYSSTEPGHMPPSEALQILSQIMDAVAEAHRQGVIHCDLKPENVMIDRQGEVKVMDFGMAMRAPTTIVHNPVSPGAGTPGYMAPEQLQGRADARSDIHALGSILYEMLSGRDARKRPLDFPDDTPPDLRRTILKCVHKNPDRRFQSVTELRNALGEPGGMRPLASYTGILTACLLLVVALALAFRFFSPPRQAVARAAPVAAEKIDKPPDTTKLVSDGESYLQNDLVDDALAQFDRALQLDPNLTEAHFQRGLALVKLKRWDDAIAAFKRALPGSAPERRVLWQWPSHFTPGSAHGLIWAQPNRVLFGERKGKDIVLQLVDLEHQAVRRLQMEDDHVRLNDGGFANDRMTVLLSYDSVASPHLVRLHVVAPDGHILWPLDLQENSAQLPWFGMLPRGFFTYLPSTHLLSFHDESSPQARWTRNDVQFYRNVEAIPLASAFLLTELTTQGSRLRALDLADGSDNWTLDVPEIASMVAPARDDNSVYFVSTGGAGGELIAVEFGADSSHIRWRKPIGKTLTSLRTAAGRLYAATTTGDLLTIDTQSGDILKTSHLDSGILGVDYADANLVVASSATFIYGVAKKQWQYPSRFARKNVKVAGGLVLVRTAEDEIVALDADTGVPLWRHSGKLVANGVFTTPNGLFIADEDGVLQYSTEKPTGALTNTRVFTEVASALLNKGNVTDASTFINKVEHEIDPASPELRLLRARLSHAPLKAGPDLAAFATASGLASEASRPVMDDLKSGYGLLWAQASETILPGKPARVGRWLLNLGAGMGTNMQLLALDPETGEPAWRQPAQRFVDSVAVTSKSGARVFYVTGNNADPAAAILRRVDSASGEAIDVAQWKRTQPVIAGRIAFAAGRLFVLTVSINLQTRLSEIEVAGFDAVSGKPLWPSQVHPSNPLVPIGLFMPQGDSLIYSAGLDIWTIRGADGSVLDHQLEKDIIGPNVSHDALAAGPIYYVTARREISAYDPAHKQITNSARPEVDSAQLTVRDGVLFGTDKGSLYAFDLHSGIQWQIPATETSKFLNFQDGDKNLWAFRDDNALVAIDRKTGKVLNEQSTLWRPSAYTISSGRLYAYTADGLAYALRLLAPR